MMSSTHLKLGATVLLAPLMAACAQSNNRLVGPPIPEPLTIRQAAEMARGQVGDAGGRLAYVDDLDDGQLFGIDGPGDSRDGAGRDSRLLFVHDDGSILEWPGR